MGSASVDWLERATTAQLAGATVGAILAAILGAVFLPDPWRWGAVILGVVFVIGMGWVAVHRQRIANEPLRLVDTALKGRLNGAPVYRFRAVLGRGRPMKNARVEVLFLPEKGEPISLDPVIPEAPMLLGPWTIAAVDRARGIDGPGRFQVKVTAEERGRTWQVEGEWSLEDVQEGRFAAPVARTRGRVRWDPGAFDRVE